MSSHGLGGVWSASLVKTKGRHRHDAVVSASRLEEGRGVPLGSWRGLVQGQGPCRNGNGPHEGETGFRTEFQRHLLFTR